MRGGGYRLAKRGQGPRERLPPALLYLPMGADKGPVIRAGSKGTQGQKAPRTAQGVRRSDI